MECHVKKLILVTDAWLPQVNGVVVTLQKMVELSIDHGWRVEVIEPSQFKTIPTPTYPEIRTAINPWKIRRKLEGADSIHIATEGSLGIAARIICGKRKWAYTTGFHTNFPEYIQRRTKIPASKTIPLFRKFHAKSSAVLVPSFSTKEKLDAAGFKNVVLWGRGFDEDIFYPRLKFPSVIPRLLYVGRVSVEKNLVPLLEMTDGYDVTIVGDGPARKKLERDFPSAHFLGYKRGLELAEAYSAADVFVFPSRTDTFGIVMIEAMACGTPVAAYPVEGPKDAVIDGVGGFLDEDLETAIDKARKLPLESILSNAKRYSWSSSADTFFSNLVRLDGSIAG